MELATFKDILAPSGQAALQAAVSLEPREENFLGHFQVLSRSYPANLARAVLEIAILRSEAGSKFPFAERLYFTLEALEQASSFEVSTYRAERFRTFPYLADLGCSAGGDTLALAAIAPTLGMDLDPLRLAMAQANLQTIDLAERVYFLRADLAQPLPLKREPGQALFFDPARRAAGRRVFSIRDYLPPLGQVNDWLAHFPAIGVKISPGVKLVELSDYDAEIEFISLRGELKEAVLWFGPLKTARRRATVLPGPYSMDMSSIDLPAQPVERISEPNAYLFEPDPSILRAGLVTSLGAQLDAFQLDADIAYLTSSKLSPTPFARAWAVEDWFPFGLKRLRAYLRQRQVGQVVVKKRGSPLQPEALIRDLHLKGDQERLVFLTHLRGRPIAIVCFPSPGSN
jgi:hypothetical protein